jgi:hypothetical protein
MSKETADGKQNFKLASILFFSELSTPSGILLADSACNSTKSYLSSFSKLPKGNGAPHANTIKLGMNCMRCSVTLCEFAKRTQITFGAVAKGNKLLL